MTDRTGLDRKLSETTSEIEELRQSISTTRTHGVLYYLLLVALFFIGFSVGYATHNLVGAAIIVVGLTLVAWREVTGYKARKTVLEHVLNEKLSEKRAIEERQKEFEIER